MRIPSMQIDNIREIGEGLRRQRNQARQENLHRVNHHSTSSDGSGAAKDNEVTTLITYLSNPDNHVRWEAVMLLLDRIDEPEYNTDNTVASALINALGDTDGGVSFYAHLTLAKMEPRFIVPLLVKALSSANRKVRYGAEETINSIGSNAIPYLLDELKKKDQS